jgi:Arc/MetJ-type ribon-helix-helix transcriptional regulator
MGKRPEEVRVQAKLSRRAVRIIDSMVKRGLYRSRSEAVSMLVQGWLDYLKSWAKSDEGAEAGT